MKYLLLLALVGYVYYAWRKQRLTGGGQASGTGAAPGPGRRPPAPQDMVPCATCGLHLPQGESLTDGRGRHFCCAQHRDQGGA